MDEYNKEQGAILKRERLRKKMTQQQLAALLDIDRSMISYYETGANDPGSRRLKKMAKLFGCSINKLLPVSE